jgi:hypothetical protein
MQVSYPDSALHTPLVGQAILPADALFGASTPGWKAGLQPRSAAPASGAVQVALAVQGDGLGSLPAGAAREVVKNYLVARRVDLKPLRQPAGSRPQIAGMHAQR